MLVHPPGRGTDVCRDRRRAPRGVAGRHPVRRRIPAAHAPLARRDGFVDGPDRIARLQIPLHRRLAERPRHRCGDRAAVRYHGRRVQFLAVPPDPGLFGRGPTERPCLQPDGARPAADPVAVERLRLRGTCARTLGRLRGFRECPDDPGRGPAPPAFGAGLCRYFRRSRPVRRAGARRQFRGWPVPLRRRATASRPWPGGSPVASASISGFPMR